MVGLRLLRLAASSGYKWSFCLLAVKQWPCCIIYTLRRETADEVAAALESKGAGRCTDVLPVTLQTWANVHMNRLASAFVNNPCTCKQAVSSRCGAWH